MAEVICPTCGFALSVDREGGAIEMRYDVAEWRSLCTSQGGDGPAHCAVMGPRVRAMVREIAKRLNGRDPNG